MKILRQLLHWLIVSLFISGTLLAAAEHPQLKAFPEAEQGMVRFVFALPHKERNQEQHYKVELLVGKEMETDGVNLIRLGSRIEPRPLEGWGYTYYEVQEASASISTLMAAPEGAARVKKFVTTMPILIRYNSRLPIVVYVPEGYQVKVRIWTAADSYQAVEQG